MRDRTKVHFQCFATISGAISICGKGTFVKVSVRQKSTNRVRGNDSLGSKVDKVAQKRVKIVLQ